MRQVQTMLYPLMAVLAVVGVLAFASESASAQAENPTVVIATSVGDITVELNRAKAPISVKNFLTYAEKGFYDNTIFHRVIPNFMIQGGGMTADMTEKKTEAPIKNESGNGLSNARGTIAMARTSNPNSATSQFFINVADNTSLDNYGGGYAVFGKVVDGMDVVDKIVNVRTTTKGPNENVPVEPIMIKSVKVKD